MLKSWGKLFCLYLLFTVEVRVHADELWLREPQDCSPNEAQCVWQAKSSRAAAQWNEQSIFANSKAIIEFSSQNRWRLVNGLTRWVAISGSTLEIPYADVTGVGQVLVERAKDRTELTVIEGEFTVAARTGQQVATLPEGYSVIISQPSIKGQSIDLPRPASVEKTLRNWFSTHDGDKKSFRAATHKWLANVSVRAEAASEWQKGLLAREIASERAAAIAEAKARKVEESKRQEMRQLFRKLNYIDP